MPPAITYRLFPLGDSAITIDFGNRIDEDINKEVIARFREWTEKPLPGIKELIPAYSSLTVFYDIAAFRQKPERMTTVYEIIKNELEKRLTVPAIYKEAKEQLIRVPVCYDKEFAIDIQRVAGAGNISVEEVISIHTSKLYKVYMLGFLPGFAYMGEVDERIATPRKPQPLPIPAGSVGIAGKQTGIYPLNSPGGWQIIGRTPLKLFDPEKEDPVLLKAGDTIQFYSIDREEYNELLHNNEPGV